MKIRLDFENTTMLFQQPIKVFLARELDVIERYLTEMASFIEQGYYVVGYLAYESSPAFNHFNKTHDPKENELPLLLFGVFKDFTTPGADEAAQPRQAQLTLHSNTTRAEYNDHIAQIRKQIQQGNTYQINYTIQFTSQFSDDPYGYYLFLQKNNRANYCAYISYQDLTILSISPELFFKVNDRVITTKPMKGTTARGRNRAEDRAKLDELLSEKNQAENMMIVDLLRNDLSRISEPGTVRVTTLFEAEPYPTVWQLTSTIESRLKADITLFQLFQALFPCGSITGAPKASSMEIIAALEKQPRGVYCGSIGYVAPLFTQAIFNIPIRTLTIIGDRASYGVGGGITWDSTASGEYNEVLEKTAILHSRSALPAYLIETLLCADGRYFLLDEHLNRIADSASYFAFQLDKAALHEHLLKLAKQCGHASYRVRVTLPADGRFNVERIELTQPMQINAVQLATTPVNSTNIYLYHKTSNRQHFPPVSIGSEILCYNEKGEITEFVNGNIMLYLDNQWVTPKLESGLLPGTMRQHYLADQQMIEQTVLLSDIDRVAKIAFINSVRGRIAIADVALAELKEQVNAHLKH